LPYGEVKSNRIINMMQRIINPSWLAGDMDRNILLIDGASLLRKQKALIIADLHIGYDNALNRQGVMIPRTQQGLLLTHLRRLLKLRAKRVIINGDLLHDFGTISHQERYDALEVLEMMGQASEMLLIRGNHDTQLDTVITRKGIKTVDCAELDGYHIRHGHTLPSASEHRRAHTFIIGHEHPAVTLADGSRRESFKCYLWGSYRHKKLLVLPSLYPLIEGTDVRKGNFLGPFLSDARGFRVYVYDRKLYDFGLVGDLQ
jgi:uncharacterized protein